MRRTFLGHGIGLRREHYAAILAGESAGDWLEAISENYMGVGGRARRILLALRERYPMTLHGVSLGIGGTDPVDEEYLDALKALAEDVEPAWVSDHLCWTGVGGRTSHDLLPLPFTEESLANVVSRVAHVQERLGRPLILENVSSYVRYRVSTMPEQDFVAEVARQSGCGILLDVNNVFVSATNHGYDAREYLAAIPAGSVWQMHLAGPSEMGPLLVDTHDHPVRPEVWDLYREAAARFGEVSTLVEWDDQIPDLGVVRAERDRAAAIMAEVQAGRTGSGRTGSVPFSVLTENGTDPIASIASGPVLCDSGSGIGSRAERAAGTRKIEDQDLIPVPLTPVPRRLENQDLTPFSLFFDLVTAPEGVAKTLDEREARGDGAREAVAGVFGGDERMAAEERLDVYANMYFFRLRDVLAEDFARTAAALGEARWHNLVTDYLLAHPPKRWSLRWAGEALPGFLCAHAYGAERPWLADVAALEWARNEAFQARDAEPMRVEDLVNVHPEVWPTLRFVAVPGAVLTTSRYDLAAWWAEGAEAQADGPREAQGGRVLLVSRDGDGDVRHEVLTAEDVEPARRLLSGAPFAEVCDAFAPEGAGETEAEEAGRKAVSLLLRWGSVLRSTLYAP